jgi:hypothetical protein
LHGDPHVSCPPRAGYRQSAQHLNQARRASLTPAVRQRAKPLNHRMKTGSTPCGESQSPLGEITVSLALAWITLPERAADG